MVNAIWSMSFVQFEQKLYGRLSIKIMHIDLLSKLTSRSSNKWHQPTGFDHVFIDHMAIDQKTLSGKWERVFWSMAVRSMDKRSMVVKLMDKWSMAIRSLPIGHCQLVNAIWSMPFGQCHLFNLNKSLMVFYPSTLWPSTFCPNWLHSHQPSVINQLASTMCPFTIWPLNKRPCIGSEREYFCWEA